MLFYQQWIIWIIFIENIKNALRYCILLYTGLVIISTSPMLRPMYFSSWIRSLSKYNVLYRVPVLIFVHRFIHLFIIYIYYIRNIFFSLYLLLVSLYLLLVLTSTTAPIKDILEWHAALMMTLLYSQAGQLLGLNWSVVLWYLLTGKIHR